MTTNQGFKSLICKNNLNNLYMYYLIGVLRNEFISLASGSTFLEISKAANEETKIALLLIDEHELISNILSALDNTIEKYQQKKSDYTQLKTG